MSFQKWYEKNKEQLSKKRKKRYKSDAGYRRKRIMESRRYYWLRKRRAAPVDARRIDWNELEVEPDTTMSIVVTNENDIREGLAVPVPMYGPSTVAKLLGRKVQTLRLWYLRGWLPEATYRSKGGYRMLTEDQFRVLAENRHLLLLPSRVFGAPFFAAVRRGWGALEPDGIVPMPRDAWRLDPSVCPWCGATPSLQAYDAEKRRWENVPCFSCQDASEVDSPAEACRDVATLVGECPRCGRVVVEEACTADGVFSGLRCPFCGFGSVPFVRQ